MKEKAGLLGSKRASEMDLSFYYMSWLLARFARSWGQKVRRLREKIEEQRPDEVDRIYDEVKDEANRIFVENERPEEATIEVYGVRIRKVIVHHNTEKYNGADVYMEVANEKFALTQFKLQHKGRYHFDPYQLDNLGKWCDYCVEDKSRPFLCPSFVWLIDDSDYYDKHRIFKRCQVLKILNGRSSAPVQEFERHGITRSSFNDLLAKCWVGAPFKRKPSIRELTDYVASTKRLVVSFFVE